MTRYPNLEAYALFYEKIDSGNPHATSKSASRQGSNATVPTLPKEQLAQLSQDLSHPMTHRDNSNPHTSQQ